jgi:hypothetical protein
MKKMFTNPFSNGYFVSFILILAMKLAQYLSVKTNSFQAMRMCIFLERQRMAYSNETGNQTLQLPGFGHRHLPLKLSVGKIQNM